MKILFYLHHPAHFHLFKNTINELSKNNKITIIATKKDILEDLLKSEGFKYKNFLPIGRKDNRVSIAFGLLKQDLRLFFHCLFDRPKLMIGTSTEICHIGKLLFIPNIFVNEDDVKIVPLVGKLAHPFAKHLLSPRICETGAASKTIAYEGYHELAYLHPNVFEAKREIAEKYVDITNPYFILRFAKLGAHHDKGIKGINYEVSKKLIDFLSPHGKIYITSERELEPELEPYRISINPLDIHHVMAFANIFIGDSQTMAAESGVLGVPFIRFNDFVGRIGYLNELENKYQLGYGIKTNEVDKLYELVNKLLSSNNLKAENIKRREKMLEDKIDVSAFFNWFFANYPKSYSIMLENPNYQSKFKLSSKI